MLSIYLIQGLYEVTSEFLLFCFFLVRRLLVQDRPLDVRLLFLLLLRHSGRHLLVVGNLLTLHLRGRLLLRLHDLLVVRQILVILLTCVKRHWLAVGQEIASISFLVNPLLRLCIRTLRLGDKLLRERLWLLAVMCLLGADDFLVEDLPLRLLLLDLRVGTALVHSLVVLMRMLI